MRGGGGPQAPKRAHEEAHHAFNAAEAAPCTRNRSLCSARTTSRNHTPATCCVPVCASGHHSLIRRQPTHADACELPTGSSSVLDNSAETVPGHVASRRPLRIARCECSLTLSDVPIPIDTQCLVRTAAHARSETDLLREETSNLNQCGSTGLYRSYVPSRRAALSIVYRPYVPSSRAALSSLPLLRALASSGTL